MGHKTLTVEKAKKYIKRLHRGNNIPLYLHEDYMTLVIEFIRRTDLHFNRKNIVHVYFLMSFILPDLKDRNIVTSSNIHQLTNVSLERNYYLKIGFANFQLIEDLIEELSINECRFEHKNKTKIILGNNNRSKYICDICKREVNAEKLLD